METQLNVYGSFADFIASLDPIKVLSYHAPESIQMRLDELLEMQKDTSLSKAEQEELDHFLILEHIVRLSKSFFRYQCDHIISRKHGGDTKFENLAYACPIFNSAKGSDLATLSKDLKNLVRLFNPRIDTWSEHFKLESGTIISSTEIGTATIKLLKLNEVNRILERLDLIQAGLYP